MCVLCERREDAKSGWKHPPLPYDEYISLDEVKQAREEIEQLYEDYDGYDPWSLNDYAIKVDEVLDKLIKSTEQAKTLHSDIDMKNDEEIEK